MDNITSVAFTAGQDKVEFDKKDDTWSEKGDADFPVNQDTLNTAVGGVASLSAAQDISDVEEIIRILGQFIAIFFINFNLCDR